MTKTKPAALLACTLALLAACDRPPSLGPGEELFGNAVNQNIAVQVVNDTPPATIGTESYSGTRAAASIERYETGEVTEPADVGTTDVTGLSD
jgi:hypothetical protein